MTRNANRAPAIKVDFEPDAVFCAGGLGSRLEVMRACWEQYEEFNDSLHTHPAGAPSATRGESMEETLDERGGNPNYTECIGGQ